MSEGNEWVKLSAIALQACTFQDGNTLIEQSYTQTSIRECVINGHLQPTFVFAAPRDGETSTIIMVALYILYFTSYVTLVGQ